MLYQQKLKEASSVNGQYTLLMPGMKHIKTPNESFQRKVSLNKFIMLACPKYIPVHLNGASLIYNHVLIF